MYVIVGGSGGHVVKSTAYLYAPTKRKREKKERETEKRGKTERLARSDKGVYFET
jgi:hypothetical protein